MQRFLGAALVLIPAAHLVQVSAAHADCDPSDGPCLEAEAASASAPAAPLATTPTPTTTTTPATTTTTVSASPGGQVVVVQAPPPVVVVPNPAPPPPPPVAIVAPPVPPQPAVVVKKVERFPQRVGLHAHVGFVASDDVAMGGFSGAFRFRPVPRFALDFGVGVYGGNDYYDRDRVEVPITIDGLLYVNPRSRFQFYFLGGVGLTLAHAEGPAPDGTRERDFAYAGGELGVGVEWRIGNHFALNTDIRGFIRRRIDDHATPEFIRSDGQTTDVSGGGIWTLGGTIYF